jgi:hypothetical protein
MRQLVFAAAVLLTVMSCGGDIASPPTDLTVTEGIYSFGFEASFLGPCGRSETWWLNPTPEFLERYAALGLPAYGEAFVRLTGRVSGLGSYGHLGLACREFTVVEVREVRPAGAEDCRLNVLIRGVVVQPDPGVGCSGWGIRSGGGTQYEITDLPAAFRSPGLVVVAHLQLRRDMLSTCMSGPIADVLEIEKGV